MSNSNQLSNHPQGPTQEELDAEVPREVEPEMPWQEEWPMRVLGWMYAKTCVLATEGKDIREMSVPELAEEMDADMWASFPDTTPQMTNQMLFEIIAMAVGGGFAMRQFSQPAVEKLCNMIEQVMRNSKIGGSDTFALILKSQILSEYTKYKQLETELGKSGVIIN